MKKLMTIIMIALGIAILSGCDQTSDIKCGEGTIEVDGKCVADTLTCAEGESKVNGECVVDEVTCTEGESLVNGECVADEVTCTEGESLVNGECVTDELTCGVGEHEEFGACVPDVVTCDTGYRLENDECVLINTDIPVWFNDWTIITEPVGDKTINDLMFTENGFSVNLGFNSRVGIQMSHLVFEPGYSYEVSFDYNSTEVGKPIFVQLQAHGGYVFTNAGVMTSGTTETFTQTLAYPPTAPGTTDGWLTIELLPSSIIGEVSIENIVITKVALPSCGVNEVLKGLECVPSNNGFIPNGTPTAWFDGWELLTGPVGNKEISDYEFSETGFTAYLDQGERTGIQMLNYVFESGFTYELTFEYTASEAGRMIWIQMEALGGYGFTNTDTWTIDGTATFTQTLIIPSSYVPTEAGWIKLELTPGVMDNVTIDNIQIIKTAN
jgi:hypothetical protein